MGITLCTVKGCPFEGRYCRAHGTGKVDTAIKEENKLEKAKKGLPKPVKKVASKSEKRKEEDKEYLKARDLYLKEHPKCEAECVPGCKGMPTEIHHKRKKRTKDDRINPEHFLAVCRPCHLHIEAHPARAYELGLSIKAVD